MNGEIEISRELAERIASALLGVEKLGLTLPCAQEIRDLIGAPAIEHHVDFWSWLDYAYRDGSKGEQPKFTKYNMEVAYQAGFTAAPVVERQPVAWMYSFPNGSHPTVTLTHPDIWFADNGTYVLTPLFDSQVLAVMPGRQPEQECDYTKGWNACLDKVKELNQ